MTCFVSPDLEVQPSYYPKMGLIISNMVVYEILTKSERGQEERSAFKNIPHTLASLILTITLTALPHLLEKNIFVPLSFCLYSFVGSTPRPVLSL